MPNNIYIGARYVPKYEGLWDATRSYEGLSVVKYGNDTYTSKGPVPVGVDILNETYWYLSGSYDGYIADLNRRMTAAEESITTLNTDVDTLDANVSQIKQGVKNIIYIGDSFMYGPSHLTQALDARLNVGHSYNCAYGGTGFVRDTEGRSFPHQLDNAAQNDSIPNESITDVIIVGGINDGEDVYQSQFEDAIQTMIARRNTSFPNAKMWFVPMAYGTDNLTQGAQEKYFKIYNACVSKGVATLPYAYTFLAGLDPTTYLLPNDPVHPSDAGCARIAGYICDWINGGIGSVDDYVIHNIQTVAEENVNECVIVRNGMIFYKLFFYSRDHVYTANTKICDVDKRINTNSGLKVPVMQAVTAGEYDGQLYILNGGLYSTTDFGYCDVTVCVELPIAFIW